MFEIYKKIKYVQKIAEKNQIFSKVHKKLNIFQKITKNLKISKFCESLALFWASGLDQRKRLPYAV